MIRTLRSVVLSCLVAAVLSAGLVFASAETQTGVFLPVVVRRDMPATLHVPDDYLIDSPFIAFDSKETEYLTVQAVVGSDHAKVAVVYVIEPSGKVREVFRDQDIYGSPKLLARPDGIGIVYGADRDGGLHWATVPGWQP